MPQTAFLYSVAGLSFTLVGFSGLIAALSRDGSRTPLIVYRVRQIPEMALASALIALITLPLVDSTGSSATAIRVASAIAFAFTAIHVGLLLQRARSLRLSRTTWVMAVAIDLGIFAAGVTALVTGGVASYEWLLVLLVTRAGIAFVLALRDVMIVSPNS